MHIGLIPDGNRRWARARGMHKSLGHKKGVEKIREFLKWCRESRVEEVSIFILSSENIRRREKEEVEFLKKLLLKEIKRYEERLEEYDIRFVGEYWLLGQEVKEELERAMSKSKEIGKEGRMRVNFLVGYGGLWEIEEAHKKGYESIRDGLIIKKDVDLIIRTGKETRISNFLLYQSAYAEIYFYNNFWPSFSKKDFEKIMKWFDGKERRFGA